MDVVFDLRNRAQWTAQGLTRISTDGAPAWDINGDAAALRYTAPLSACLASYTHLLVRASAALPVVPRILYWSLQLDGGAPAGKSLSARIPLLGDGSEHTYTLALRLLDIGQAARLTGFSLAFEDLADPSAPRRVQINDVRLIGYHPGSYCP